VNQSFYSTAAESLDDYIWVMANQAIISGDGEIISGSSGSFTLELNGPFDGSIFLNDTFGGVSQGGVFSNGGSCDFTFADYNSISNTTSCTFTYTPAPTATNRVITITPSTASNYIYNMSATSANTTVLGRPFVSSVTPNSGLLAGGTMITINGGGFISQDIVWQQVSAGFAHTCAITSSGLVYCWGDNTYGQLGTGNNTRYTVPTLIDTSGVLNGEVIAEVVAGANHTCVLTASGQAYCLGDNTAGQLGTGDNNSRNTPTAVLQGAMPSLTVKQISAGGGIGTTSGYTCAIASDDQAYCWGDNTTGQLGAGDTAPRDTPIAVLQGAMPSLAVKQITTGQYHTCVINVDDFAYCWGQNYYANLGNNDSAQQNSPVAVYRAGVLNGLTIKQISAGGRNVAGSTCVIASDDHMYCWGVNDFGQLAAGTSTLASYVPVAAIQGEMPSLTVLSVELGEYHGCAIASNNQAYCWGYNGYGRLGNNDQNIQLSPTAVWQGQMTTMAVRQISPGTEHTCAVGGDNQVYCWGASYNAQLGDGTLINKLVPSAVSKGAVLTITLDGIACANITILSDSQLSCITPAHAAGWVDVTVNLPTGAALTLVNGFEYTNAMISVSTSASSVDLAVSLGTPFDQGSIIVYVTTDNSSGYSLTIESGGANLVCSSSSSLTVPSTSAGGNAVDAGTWGFQVGISPALNSWLPTPTTTTQIDSSNGPTFSGSTPASRDTQVNFAARNSSPIPIDTSCAGYVQTVTYTAVAAS